MSRETFVSTLLVAAGLAQVRVSGFDMQSPPYPMEPHCLAVNTRSGDLYAADRGVLVVGRPGLQAKARIAAETRLDGLAYCESEDKLYGSAYLDNAIFVLDCASRSVLGRVPLGRSPDLLLYAGAANRLLIAISGTEDQQAQLLVLDCATDSLVDSITLDSICGPGALGYNPATRRTYWVPYLGRPATIDLGTGSVRVLDYWASDVAVNATGSKVWLACRDNIAVLDGTTDSLLAWVDVDTAWDDVKHLVYNQTFDKVYGTTFDDWDYVSRTVVIDGAGDTLVAAIESGEDDLFMGPVALSGDGRYLCQQGVVGDSFGFVVIDCEHDSVVALLGSNWSEGEMVSVPGGPEACFAAYRGVLVTIDGGARVVADTLVTTDRYVPAALACDDDRDRLYVYCDCPPDELGLVAVVEPGSGRISRFLPGFVDSDALFYSPRQYKLYCQYYDDVLGVLDLATGERRSVLRHQFDDLQVLGGSRTRDRFYCIGESEDEYWLLGLQGMGILQDTVELPDQPTVVCFDAGSGRVYLAFERDTASEVVFWQEGDDTLSAGVVIPEEVEAMQRAGARLLCFGDGKLTMLDIGLRGAIPSTMPCGCIDARCGVLCDRTGTEVFFANQDTLVALDLAWPDSTRRIPVPDIDTLIRFPGARHILCVGREVITVIDIGLDSVVQTVHVEFDRWTSAVDTVGRCIYFAEGDRTIRMLEYDYEPLLAPGPVPTIVSGNVFLAGEADCQVYDINGRRMMVLAPGDNDLSRLPAGVYFARWADSGGGTAVRKVVVQR